MSDMSDFQKQFFSKGTQNTLFTQAEFDEALQAAQAEIIAMAIVATKEAVIMEREACAKLIEEWSDGVTDPTDIVKTLAEKIRNRVPAQRQ